MYISLYIYVCKFLYNQVARNYESEKGDNIPCNTTGLTLW